MSPARTASSRTLAVGVVIPVHNEEELLGAALASLADAFTDLRGRGLDLRAAVVLDDCLDNSAQVVAEWEVGLRRKRQRVNSVVRTCAANNVGVARGLGCAALLDEWTFMDPSRIWLATTDADSRVPRDWLSAQVSRHDTGVDLWSGRVSVDDWSSHRGDTAAQWQRAYEAEDIPIHGANLGFNAGLYLATGGFTSIRTGEDRELHRAISNLDAVSYNDSSVRVVTSSRRNARAPLGFAHALNIIAINLDVATSSTVI
jgi:glycosyltransferase involved in cell wall biosynthesis